MKYEGQEYSCVVSIPVTQDDIDRGSACDACNCPVALAAKRMWAEDYGEAGVRVDVIGNGMTVEEWSPDGGGTVREFYLPSSFMSDFDNGKSVQPQEVLAFEQSCESVVDENPDDDSSEYESSGEEDFWDKE